MAIRYRLYQNNREGSSTKGKWYARAVALNTTGTDTLAINSYKLSYSHHL